MSQENHAITHSLRAKARAEAEPGTTRQRIAARKPGATILSFCIMTLLSASAPRAQTPLAVSLKEKFDLGEYKEVTTLLQSALAQEPQNNSFAFWLMRSYFEQDLFEEAITSGERAVAGLPSSSEYHLWLGRSYSRKAEKKRSINFARKTREEFEKAVELDPANLGARRDLMEFYLAAPWFLGVAKTKPGSRRRPSRDSIPWRAPWRAAPTGETSERWSLPSPNMRRSWR